MQSLTTIELQNQISQLDVHLNTQSKDVSASNLLLPKKTANTIACQTDAEHFEKFLNIVVKTKETVAN